MTEQEELVQDIRERLGEMRNGTLPFDLLAFATTIGPSYSMTVDEKSSGFVGILAQPVKRPLSENELGAALSLA
jgi:hypothetical protein